MFVSPAEMHRNCEELILYVFIYTHVASIKNVIIKRCYSIMAGDTNQ